MSARVWSKFGESFKKKEISSALKGNLYFPLHPQCNIFHQGRLLNVMTLRIPEQNVEKQ